MAGTPLLWVVFFSSLGVAGFGTVIFLGGEAWGAAVAAVGALAALGSLVAQIRFSPRQAARVLGVTLLFPGLIVALAGLAVSGPPLLPVGGLIGAVGAALAVYGLRARKNPVSSVAELTGAQSFYESDGVHFLVGWSDRPVARRGSFAVEVIAQNIMTAPRTLRVRLDGVGQQAFEQTEHSLPLEPGVVVRASVPFRLTALAEGTLRFAVDVSGRGTENGIRVRREQGSDYVVDYAGANLLGAVTLLTLGAGTFRWGPSKQVQLKVDEQAPLEALAPEAVVTALHTPTADDLQVARRL
jgi:hypothetical protein